MEARDKNEDKRRSDGGRRTESAARKNHDRKPERARGAMKGQSLQDPFLNMLRKERVPVSIYLTSGIKLQGQIESFDQFVVLLRNSVSQMVYKHAISTVVPSRNIRLPHGPAAEDRGGGRERESR